MITTLDTIENWVGEVPPQPTPQRFGNLAFREWGRLLEDVRSSHCHVTRYSLAFPALGSIIKRTTSRVSRTLHPAHHPLSPWQLWLFRENRLWLGTRALLCHVPTVSLTLAIFPTYCR